MLEGSTPPIPMNVGQAQALVEYVEIRRTPPASVCGYGPTTISQDLSTAEPSAAVGQDSLHPSISASAGTDGRRIRAISGREVEYLRERLAYVESKLQQLWQTAGLSEPQVRIICEGLELPFTYRELTEMWERGI